nr:GntR family transcriptional regulator [Propionicimonas sp.]
MVIASPEQERPGDAVPSLVDVVQDYLRARITAGVLAPGDRLKERDLAEETGISRMPIREALRILASEGFVTLNPRRGAVVAHLEPEDLDEIYEVREALEVQEAVLAARKAQPDEIALMRSCVEESERAWAVGDRRAADQANVAFHAVLVRMAHNEVLAKTLEPLQNRLNWLLRQNTDPRELCVEHRDMVEAIAAGDVEAARRLAICHVATSKKVALQQLFGNRSET